jgi:hypothetical protein
MSMRKFILFLVLFISCQQISIAQLSYQDDIPKIVVNYNPSCMKKFEYKTDAGYIVEDSYTNYHIPIGDDKTLILKINASEATLPSLDPRKLLQLNCYSAKSIDHDFVERVNMGVTVIYLVNKHTGAKGDSTTIYHVNHAIYQEMNDHYMRFFAPPYFSFIYDYDQEHFPGDNLPADDANPRKFDTRFYLYGEETVENVRNDILLKMYYDACYNRPYGITTVLSPKGQNNPYKQTIDISNGKLLYRSCQHPIHSEYLKGIGLYKETYYEDGKAFVSKLVSIDGIPIQQYLKLVSNNYKFENINDNLSSFLTSEQHYVMKSGNTTKGEDDIPTNFSNNAKKDDADLKIHTVSKGETLYGLSKKYNISINELKMLNSLEDNTIYVNQPLMIKDKRTDNM